VDVRNAAAVRFRRERLVGETGRIDVLINGAGVTAGGLSRALTLSENVWRIILDTNLKGTLNAVQSVGSRHEGAAQRADRERHGPSSTGTASRASRGVRGVQRRALRRTHARLGARVSGRFGVTVNAVSPGYIDTPMNAKNGPELVQRAVERTPPRADREPWRT